MKNYLLAAVPCLLLVSCQLNSRYLYNNEKRDMPAYVTPVANVNVQKEKGQFQNSSFVGSNHIENQMSYNFTDKYFAQADGYLSLGIRGGNKRAGNIGLGTYLKFAKGRMMSTTSAGYGYAYTDYLGFVQYSGEHGLFNQMGRTTVYETRRIETSSKMNKVYLQSNLTCFTKNERHSFSLGFRLNMLYFNAYHYRVQNYRSEKFGYETMPPPAVTNFHITTQDITMAHKSAQVLDSYLTYTVKVKNRVQLYLQALLNTPLSKTDRNHEHYLINDPGYPLLSAGLTFTLGPKKKD